MIGYIMKSNSYKYHGPDSNDIKKNIYKFGNQCYKFIPIPYICPIN